ncbi:MAG TPA: iduronate-2-sulfatase [Dysgonomonas sp.]|nr:iduronate-2-sulfatase [Dysgonomonas sp.]
MKTNNIKKNTILALSALACTGSAMGQSGTEQAKKYNVIFIASDDLANTMHTFNNEMVSTPNLDRLAERGVVFNYAHNQFPLSGPSRASILTGMRPDQTNVFNLTASFRDDNPDAQTLPELFKNNGYYTARVGKIFHAGVPGDIGRDGHDDPQSWMQKYNPIGRDKTEEHLVTNHTPERKVLGSTLSFMAMDATDAELTDGMVANVTVKLMRDAVKSRKNQPFFIAAGFYRPHCPYIAPQKYFDMYPLDKIQLPEQRDDDWDNKPEAAKFTNPLNWGLTEQQQKEVLQSYYASITFMDAQVGTILDGVKELGLEDNTIIVFWSDHGYNTGHHGQWMKQSLFDQVTRTPLLIAIPGMKANGQETDNHVEFVDIYPTIAEACGIQTPANVQGVNLKPILEDAAIHWDRPAFTQVQRVKKINDSDHKKTFFGRTVRYGNLRYTEWDEGREGIELYDYAADPNEFTNFANNKKYKKDQEKLQKMLRASYTK